MSNLCFKFFCLLLLASLLGCNSDFIEIDSEAPAVPRGVFSITGDQKVTISWYPNHESDFSGYNVYRSASENTGYYVSPRQNNRNMSILMS